MEPWYIEVHKITKDAAVGSSVGNI